ncbi:dynein light chain Tctex-type 3 isoform X1 [Dendrobates tinctorius]|uniref:dynein light chain Tctex-type 3 isoform X1 n=1 Tax=Dendrobates tinctorius TaxID=92724 RepID=UPI003CC9777F
MEDHQHKAENPFNGDEASSIVKECVDVILGGVDYDDSRVNEWMSAVVEQSLTHLVKMEKAFKYIVTCTVMQKRGGGLHTASSSFWDNSTDALTSTPQSYSEKRKKSSHHFGDPTGMPAVLHGEVCKEKNGIVSIVQVILKNRKLY